MVNRMILILLFSFVVSALSAQVNVSFDDNCIRKNTAALSQALIDLKGENFVSNLLKNDIKFSIFCNVDSLGIVLNFIKMRSSKEFSRELEQEIILYLEANKISFYICYEKPQGLTLNEGYKLIRKDLLELSKNKNSFFTNINFPGDMMNLYCYEKDKAKKRGLFLSRYDYFVSMINKYKP